MQKFCEEVQEIGRTSRDDGFRIIVLKTTYPADALEHPGHAFPATAEIEYRDEHKEVHRGTTA